VERFVTLLNNELLACWLVERDWYILQLPAVDKYGDPLEQEGSTGYDFLPEEGKLWLTAARLRELTGETVLELLDLPAVDWVKRMAIHKAMHWQAPTHAGRKWEKYL